MTNRTLDAGVVLLTKADVAKQLQVTSRTVDQWIHDGKLQACRVGKGVRVHPADLANFITPIGGVK